MPRRGKFRHLLDITLDQLDLPDKATLTYAVCAGKDDSCGWQGWIIEAIACDGKILNAADYDQMCPACPNMLFRTDTILFVPAEDQSDVNESLYVIGRN